MNRIVLTCLFFCFLPLWLICQPKDFVNYDHTYDPQIKSVILRPFGSNTGFPIVYLTGDQPLELIFDDLNGDFTYYKYRIVQCDANWNPSQLNEIEYIQGFNDQEIREYAYSVNTRINYTQYTLQFPNDLISVSKSGNYLIHVYKDDNNAPALTKRFIVSDQLFSVNADIQGDLTAGRVDKYQRINLTISPNVRIIDPLTQVRIAVLQNGIWDSNRPLLAPKFVRNDLLIYDYLNEMSFPGWKEYRFLDIRSLRRPNFNVENLERYDDRTEIFLRNDNLREKVSYSYYPDLSGSYIIENLDNRNDVMESDYCLVHFYLRSDARLSNPVYVLGQFNEWGKDAAALPMEYDAEKKYYTTTALLKQGYYDYVYAEKLKNGSFDHSKTEGDSYETANNYQIIIYYKAYGERYERIGQYWLLGPPPSGFIKENGN